jgi:hypothetical protein
MKWMLVGDIAGDIARDSSVPATALKITTTTLVDRRVIFQDITFSSEIGKHKEAIISHFNFLRTTESDPLQALLKSKRYMRQENILSKVITGNRVDILSRLD